MPLKQIITMEPQKPPNRKDQLDQSNKPSQPITQQQSQQTAPAQHRKGPNFPKKKDKFGRKRSQSFSGINSKFCPPYKYRTRPMLPTKFLLGGNICDPLNLNSLQDEEVNRTVNAITPKSSPIPTPPQRRGHIEVIIPPNIHDPLNLIDCADDAEYEQQLTSPLKKGSKRRKKKKRTSSATTDPSDADISASEAQTPDLSNDSAKIPDVESSANSGAEDTSPKEKLVKVTRDLKLELSPVAKDKKRKSDCHKEGVKKLRRLDSMDKIVSPVVPQPGAWLKRALQFNRNAGPSNRGQHNRPSVLKPKGAGRVEKLPRFRDKNKAYQYGNYNRYYGYRNPNHEVDSRLRCFAAHRNIFEGKDILDIGCNIGHITLSIARDFGAKSVVGIDIDKKLIGIARKNVRHYVNCNDSPRDEPEHSPKLDKSDKCFPISMPILYGPVDVPGMQNDEVRGRGFPHNVTFVQGNYVLEDDSLLCTEQPQFDVILCLSITKWLHLNWGDQGLKQAFRRMYAQLKPGGKLILEPQSWASYKHKKTLTETIYKNYNSIEFFPEKFTQYLLSSEVGFAKSEIMGQPHHTAKGFQRPIQVFTRSNLSPSQSQRSYSITPSHTVTSSAGGVSKQVYTCLPSPDVSTEDSSRLESSDATVRVIEQVDDVCDSTEDRGGTRYCKNKDMDASKNTISKNNDTDTSKNTTSKNIDTDASKNKDTDATKKTASKNIDTDASKNTTSKNKDTDASKNNTQRKNIDTDTNKTTTSKNKDTDASKKTASKNIDTETNKKVAQSKNKDTDTNKTTTSKNKDTDASKKTASKIIDIDTSKKTTNKNKDTDTSKDQIDTKNTTNTDNQRINSKTTNNTDLKCSIMLHNQDNTDLKCSKVSHNEETGCSNKDSQVVSNQNVFTDTNHSDTNSNNQLTASINTDKVDRNTDNQVSASINTDKGDRNTDNEVTARINTDKGDRNTDNEVTARINTDTSDRNTDNQRTASINTDRASRNTDNQDTVRSNTEMINDTLNIQNENDTSLLSKLDCSVKTSSTHKRKHNSSNSMDDCTPVKRKYASSSIPVKRKPNSNSNAVHTYEYTKRKNSITVENDQSTCTENLRALNNVETRLELDETNDEETTECDKSTISTSTTMDDDTSNDLRIMQTKCMLDNT